jgi:hypothetical protein
MACLPDIHHLLAISHLLLIFHNRMYIDCEERFYIHLNNLPTIYYIGPAETASQDGFLSLVLLLVDLVFSHYAVNDYIVATTTFSALAHIGDRTHHFPPQSASFRIFRGYLIP